MANKVLKLLREDLLAAPEQITARIFPSIPRASGDFKAKMGLVKNAIPAYLRRIDWRRRNVWTHGPTDSQLFAQLSAPELRGQKAVGGRRDPCKCVVHPDGAIEVHAYRRSWRGWLVQQLVGLGCPNETARGSVMSLRCRAKASQLALNLPLMLKKLREFALRDSDTGLRLRIARRRLVLTFPRELAEGLQRSWDDEDEALRKQRSAETGEVVLASVSAFRSDRAFQGLGLNPYQTRQASDTLVTLGVEDRRPDFIYLVYGPPSAKPRQTGVRAVVVAEPDREVGLIRR